MAMARQFDDGEEYWDEVNYSDDDDGWNQDDDEPTMPCPYCREEIYDDSPRCPHCGKYISEEGAPVQRKPWWIILGVLLCIIVIAMWITAL
jgi:hypothetical protein